MIHVHISKIGSPDVLTLKQDEKPLPARNEVLIAVRAAGVNRLDVMQRQGNYPLPPGASPILGMEVAGEIAGVGADVASWKPGDRVCALTNGGGYAEYVVVPVGQVLSIPKGLSMLEAAALPETFFTVWTNVFDRARLQRGEKFLVHGGSSGIGTTAIQMAKAMGAWVATTAGSTEKCRACEQLGADLAVNYREKDFVEEVRAATGGYGVDVILDMVGGAYAGRNLELAATDGRLVTIGFIEGAQVEINLLNILFKRLILTGSSLRAFTLEAKAEVARQLEANIWPLIAAGRIRPKIAATFTLENSADAHRLMESGRHIGKIVLQVGP